MNEHDYLTMRQGINPGRLGSQPSRHIYVVVYDEGQANDNLRRLILGVTRHTWRRVLRHVEVRKLSQEQRLDLMMDNLGLYLLFGRDTAAALGFDYEPFVMRETLFRLKVIMLPGQYDREWLLNGQVRALALLREYAPEIKWWELHQ